jgi:hypothetical protein
MTNALLHNARLIDPEAGPKPSAGSGSRAGDRRNRRRAAPGRARLRRLCLAPGLVDVGVKVGEPGERHKESLRTAGLAAAAGGVTSMIIRPDTLTPIDTPEVLDFVRRRARDDSAVRVYPLAALTKGREGREMTEIGFLLDAGAVAFTDGDAVTTDTRVLSRCMTYAKGLGALILGHPAGPGAEPGRRRHLRQVRCAEGPARAAADGRAHGPGARPRARGDDGRALPCRSGVHRRGPARAAPRQGGGARRHGGCVDPPPDAERARRR